jgi:beta-N-acetylhexosaminidase
MRPAWNRALPAVLIACVLVVMSAVVGCGTRPPDGPPGITGSVTSLVAGDERPASMLVEGAAQPAGAASDKAQVTVNPGTMFFDAAGAPAKAAGIRVGTKVRVWFDGPVAESYPVQGSAQAVQILGN